MCQTELRVYPGVFSGAPAKNRVPGTARHRTHPRRCRQQATDYALFYTVCRGSELLCSIGWKQLLCARKIASLEPEQIAVIGNNPPVPGSMPTTGEEEDYHTSTICRPNPIAALIRQGAAEAGHLQGTARATTKVQRMINSLQWRQVRILS